MLKRVEIEGFRSCEKLILEDLGPLTVLVGRNAVGKSNILRAISWLARSATSSDSSSLVERSSGTTRVSAQIILGEDAYSYSFAATDKTSGVPWGARPDISVSDSLEHRRGDGTEKTVFRREDEEVTLSEEPTRLSIGATASSMRALLSLLPPESRTVTLVRPLYQHLEAVRYYPLIAEGDHAPHSLMEQSAYSKWLAGHAHSGSLDQAVLMRILDLKLNRSSQFAELQELLGPNGLEVIDQLDVLAVGEAESQGAQVAKWYFVGFRPSAHPYEHPHAFAFDDLSSGTQRLIAIMVSLIYDRSAVMLLEHPEDGIHHALLRKLIGILQTHSDESQVLMASHSASVLDSLDPSAVRLVTMEEGGTKARALTEEEVRYAGKYLEEEGTLSDFLETVEEE